MHPHRANRRTPYTIRHQICLRRATWSSRAPHRTTWSSAPYRPGCPVRYHCQGPTRRPPRPPQSWCSAPPAPRPRNCRKSPTSSASARGHRCFRCTCRAACAPHRGPQEPPDPGPSRPRWSSSPPFRERYRHWAVLARIGSLPISPNQPLVRGCRYPRRPVSPPANSVFRTRQNREYRVTLET